MTTEVVQQFTSPFSQVAMVALDESFGASLASPYEMYGESSSRNPFLSPDLVKIFCGMLGAVDRHHLGRECCKDLLKNGVFKALGGAAAADWKGISARLAQRAGTQVQNPAWLHTDPDQCHASVRERLKRACCASEVAIFMLRLALRTACLASSGPVESVEALEQLDVAGAWECLLHALNALLGAFEAGLAMQYNAVNIVCDILNVSRPLPLSLPCLVSLVLSMHILVALHACADPLLPDRAPCARGLPALRHHR